MEKRKTRRLVSVCLILTLMLCVATSAFAATTTYASTFPAFQGHATITQGTKTLTTTTKAGNTITGPSTATCGYFWIDLSQGSNQVSETTYCAYGGTDIPYENGVSFAGTVYLRGKAATWAFVTHEVSGVINFG